MMTVPGVVVLDVVPNTPASRLGVKRGDLVIGLNNDRVTSVAGLVKALGAPADGWRLSLQREGQVYNLAIQG
jgi:S1-C subfamily serine protease